MIKSMTGYGLAQQDGGQVQLTVEVKSLNSKFLDLSLRLPKRFSDRELEIRTLTGNLLERGKIMLNVEYQVLSGNNLPLRYNEELFTAYYNELRRLADKVVAPVEGLFELALNAPDVIQVRIDEKADEEDWERLKTLIRKALEQCDEFRVTEGKSLLKKLKEYVTTIRRNLETIEKLDPQRVEGIRKRIESGLKSALPEDGIDPNRLEQELIFYVEKLDIHEECVRLRAHLEYFSEVLEEKSSNGKKLIFISQEIGREINTIGAKANDAAMQKHVVLMKEELEKIKEQLNNIL